MFSLRQRPMLLFSKGLVTHSCLFSSEDAATNKLEAPQVKFDTPAKPISHKVKADPPGQVQKSPEEAKVQVHLESALEKIDSNPHITLDRSHIPLDKGEVRPLAIFLPYLGAREREIHKYKEIWLDRGFDTLTSRMNMKHFLMPTYGSIPQIHHLTRVLYDLSTTYPEFVMHVMSVGAYEMAEIWNQLETNRKYVQSLPPGTQRQIEDTLKGIFLDSPVTFDLKDIDGIIHGVPNAITKNPIAKKILSTIMYAFIYMTYPFTSAYYIRANKYGYNLTPNLSHLKGCLVCGSRDVVSPPHMSYSVRDNWVKLRGIDCTLKEFNCGHIMAYRKHRKEYDFEVDRWLQNIKFSKFSPRFKEQV